MRSKQVHETVTFTCLSAYLRYLSEAAPPSQSHQRDASMYLTPMECKDRAFPGPQINDALAWQPI